MPTEHDFKAGCLVGALTCFRLVHAFITLHFHAINIPTRRAAYRQCIPILTNTISNNVVHAIGCTCNTWSGIPLWMPASINTWRCWLIHCCHCNCTRNYNSSYMPITYLQRAAYRQCTFVPSTKQLPKNLRCFIHRNHIHIVWVEWKKGSG